MSTEAYKEVNLQTINNGAAAELFQAELQKVLANINDINVNSEKPREIALIFKFTPTKDRSSVTVKVQAKSKLETIAVHEGSMFLSPQNGTKAFVTNPQQMAMDFKQQAGNDQTPGK